MKIKEIEEFYNNDRGEYILSNRLGFTDWFNKNYNRNPEISTEKLQELVDKVITWYVFRYPNRQLNGRTSDYRFTDMEEISKYMSFDQLLYRFGDEELSIFECKCEKDYKNNLILRKYIIDAIAKGLLYNKHTTPEYGKYRKERFIFDVKSKYDDIDLDNINYVVEEEPLKEEKKKILKRINRR